MVTCFERWAKHFQASNGVTGAGDIDVATMEGFIREIAQILKETIEVDVDPQNDTVSDLVTKINEECTEEQNPDPTVQAQLKDRIKAALEKLGEDDVPDEYAALVKKINSMVVSTAGGMAKIPLERFKVFPKLLDEADALLTIARRNLVVQDDAVKTLTGPGKDNALVLSNQAQSLVKDVESIIRSLRAHVKDVKPKMDTLKDLIDNNDNFRERLQKILSIDLSANPERRNDAIAMAMKRLGFLPIVVKRTRDALKTLNLSIKNFKNSPSFNALLKKLDDNILGSNAAEKVKAMSDLSSTYKKGMYHDITKNIGGGAGKPPPSKYAKSLKVAKKVREVTVSLFDRTLRSLITEFDNNAHKYAEEMRKGSTPNDETAKKFINALDFVEQLISNAGSADQLDLIGWNTDHDGKSKKAAFVNAMKYVNNVSKEVKSPAATAMGKNLEKILITIDRYSDAYSKSDEARMPVVAGMFGPVVLAAAPLAVGLLTKAATGVGSSSSSTSENSSSSTSENSSSVSDSTAEESNSALSLVSKTDGGATDLSSSELGVSTNIEEHKIEAQCDKNNSLEENVTGAGGLDIGSYADVAVQHSEIAFGNAGGVYAGGVSAGCGCDGGAIEPPWDQQAVGNSEAGIGPAGAVSAGAIELGALTNSMIPLSQSIKELKYYYRIIEVQKHMREAGELLQGNTKDFEKILGKAIAKRKNLINKEFTIRIKDATDAVDTATDKAAAKGLRKYLVESHDSIIGLYDALESLEIYLKNFTDGILNHPEDISDILTMLNGTQVIIKWFDDKSADNVRDVFELFKGDKDTSIEPSKYEDLKRKLVRAFDGVDALKNVMNAFARIGEKFGNKGISTNMSIGAMYKAITNYLVISYITQDGNRLKLRSGNIPINPPANPIAPAIPLTKPFNDRAERNFFVDMIKAMVAKIFTVTGLYDMVNRPLDKADNKYNVLLRTTVGGGAPTVYTDAVELYVRLPLLSEWYRALFNFDGAASDPTISMIPDYGNVWKEVQEIFYHTSGYIANGQYSDGQFQTIIAAINKVYDHYKKTNPKNPSKAAIKGFVEDTNMRYGVLWNRDQKAYNEARKRLTNKAGDTTSNKARTRPNFEILPGEGDDAYAAPGPSSDYTSPIFLDSSYKGDKDEVNLSQGRHLIYNFRTRLMEAFNLTNPGVAYKGIHFGRKIQETREELDRSTDTIQRYNTLIRTLRNTSRIGAGQLSILVMFHEQVVFGMQTLTDTLNMLQTFKSEVESMEDAPRDAQSFSGIVNGAAMNDVDKVKKIFTIVDGFGHCKVQVRMDGSNLNIDFSELFTCTKTLAHSIRDALPKFRGKVDDTKVDTAVDELAKLEILITHLIDQELIDSDGENYEKNLKYAGVPRAVSRLNDIYASLTGDVDLKSLYTKTAATATPTLNITDGAKNLLEVTKLPSDQKRREIGTTATNADIKQIAVCGGIVHEFNALLLQYLNVFFDLSDNHIYDQLIKPITSAMHADVYGNDTKVLLHPAVAYLLSAMITGTLDVRKPGNKAFLTDNFAGVSDFMKETMRCNLPYYKVLFNRVHVNALTIRNFLTHHSLKVNDSAENMRTIEYVIKGCNAMAQAITAVSAELKDVAVAFETSSRFISEYKGMYGKDPILLASTLSVFARKAPKLMPIKQASVDEGFKLMFGVRDVMTSKDGTKASKFAYESVLLKEYNRSTSPPTRILETEFNKYLECVMSLCKYTIFADKWTCLTDKVAFNTATYQNKATTSFATTVELIESGDQDNKLAQVVEGLSSLGTKGIGGADETRKDARIVNIIDLNIMPVNVHMLAAQVPLTEVYSYAWTFDHMVGGLLSSDFQDNTSAASNALARVRDGEGATLAKMMHSPYQPIRGIVFWRQIQRVVAGLGDLPLGRPRYLDHLWRKVFNASLGTIAGVESRSPAEQLARSEGKITAQPQRAKLDVDATVSLSGEWNAIGMFGAYLMRDQFFLVNIQRLLRYQMRRDLFKSLGPVVSSHNAVSEAVTEVGSNRNVHDEANDVLKSEYLNF